MSEDKEAEKALIQAMNLLARWKPLPLRVTSKLKPETLKLLVRIVARMRAAGLGGPKYRPPDRLRRMREIIEELTGEGGGKPGPLDHLPEPLRKTQETAESKMIREADALTMKEQSEKIAALRRGSSIK